MNVDFIPRGLKIFFSNYSLISKPLILSTTIPKRMYPELE